MKKYYLALIILLAPVVAGAQSTEEQAITEIISRLFKAMQTNDTTLLKSVFGPDVTMATVSTNKEGKQVLQRSAGIAGFVKAIARPNPNGALNEEIWNVKVQIDGAFAQAWCDYAFYIGSMYSHCGVDAFQLIKTEAGWKIFHLADTRRKTGCTIPQGIQDKYK
jgi:hypothetical protein